MKEKVLITGYNGSLAKRLTSYLQDQYSIVYLSSSKKSVNNKDIFYWNLQSKYIDENVFSNCQHIIHLSGYNIINRWSKKNKDKMYASRIHTAKLLFEKCKEHNIILKTFISASAMGYYGFGAEKDVDETSPAGKDWLANLVVDWEAAANQFKEIGARIVNLRISLMMDKNSGFLKVTMLPLRFGITSVFLPSNLTYSWIHIDDLSRFVLYSLDNKEISGPYNMASPEKQTQYEVIKEIRSCVFKYALIFPIPIFLMNFIMGNRSQLIKGGLYLKVDKLIGSGFKLNHTSISSFLLKK